MVISSFKAKIYSSSALLSLAFAAVSNEAYNSSISLVFLSMMYWFS
jgi:hypothetical protein